jgi:hypothetical protein
LFYLPRTRSPSKRNSSDLLDGLSARFENSLPPALHWACSGLPGHAGLFQTIYTHGIDRISIEPIVARYRTQLHHG